MKKERYMICSKCGQAHVMESTFRSKTCTCYRCGSTSFYEDDKYQTSPSSYTPVFTNWTLQNKIDDASDKLAEYLIEKNIQDKQELINTFKTFFVAAVNMKPHDFIKSVDTLLR